MSRMTTFALIMVGISLLFYLFGIIESNPLLDILLNPQTMSTGTFWATLIGGLVVSIGAIVVGAITKNVELAVMTPIAAYLVTILWNFKDVYDKLKGAEGSAGHIVGLLLFAPFLFMFIIMIVDFWRGRD